MIPLPIARFNFTPNTVQAGLFCVSLLAFSSAGISHVDCTIDGGSSLWRADQLFVGKYIVIERSIFNGLPAPAYRMA